MLGSLADGAADSGTGDGAATVPRRDCLPSALEHAKPATHPRPTARHLTECTAQRTNARSSRSRPLRAEPTRFMKIVDRDQELAALSPRLQGARRLYRDTEFDSSKAGKKLSLVQIARDGGTPEEVFLVDALRIRDLTPLKAAFSGRNCEWVLHA